MESFSLNPPTRISRPYFRAGTGASRADLVQRWSICRRDLRSRQTSASTRSTANSPSGANASDGEAARAAEPGSDHRTSRWKVVGSRRPDTVQLGAVISPIIEALDPDLVIVFGSAARATMTADSDVDLLVVKDVANVRELGSRRTGTRPWTCSEQPERTAQQPPGIAELGLRAGHGRGDRRVRAGHEAQQRTPASLGRGRDRGVGGRESSQDLPVPARRDVRLAGEGAEGHDDSDQQGPEHRSGAVSGMGWDGTTTAADEKSFCTIAGELYAHARERAPEVLQARNPQTT